MNTEPKRHLIKSLINTFTAIPSERWCERRLTDSHGRHCALGHLGVNEEMFDNSNDNEDYPPLAREMVNLFDDQDEVTRINDVDNSDHDQRGPRARILAALHDKLKECL